MLARIPRPLSIVAIVGWLTSLLLPALSFRFDGEHDRILEGYKVLTAGYFDLIVGEFSWLANFVFWILVWRLWRRSDDTWAITVLAIALVLLTGQSAELFIWERFFQFPQAYSGYYLWIAANLILAIGALVKALHRHTALRRSVTVP